MDSGWALEVMHMAPYITVSFIDEQGKPYGLPLSLASDDDVNWYFHGALEGKKLEAIKTHPEGRQFHPAIQISHRIRQGRNRDRGCREDSWSPTDL